MLLRIVPVLAALLTLIMLWYTALSGYAQLDGLDGPVHRYSGLL